MENLYNDPTNFIDAVIFSLITKVKGGEISGEDENSDELESLDLAAYDMGDDLGY